MFARFFQGVKDEIATDIDLIKSIPMRKDELAARHNRTLLYSISSIAPLILSLNISGIISFPVLLVAESLALATTLYSIQLSTQNPLLKNLFTYLEMLHPDPS